MARHLDSVCKLCRREGVKLFLKGSRCEGPKCAIDRRNVAPGMHGYRRGKPSEYGIRLREKQKLKRFYGLFERQFRRYFELASRAPENTGEQLLSIMERRLDNVVHRLGWAPNRASARQLVGHGHVEVNGRRVDIPSYRVRKGDVITIRDKARQMVMVQWNRDVLDRTPPAWLESGDDGYAATVLDLPIREQIDVPVREQLIVELYSK